MILNEQRRDTLLATSGKSIRVALADTDASISHFFPDNNNTRLASGTVATATQDSWLSGFWYYCTSPSFVLAEIVPSLGICVDSSDYEEDRGWAGI